MIMKAKPPTMPKYIQVVAKDPSGIKKAPTVPAATNKYLRPQNLDKKE